MAQFRRIVGWVSIAVPDINSLCYRRHEVVWERQSAGVSDPTVWGPWASLWLPQVCFMLKRCFHMLVQDHESPTVSPVPCVPPNSLLFSAPGLGKNYFLGERSV